MHSNQADVPASQRPAVAREVATLGRAATDVFKKNIVDAHARSQPNVAALLALAVLVDPNSVSGGVIDPYVHELDTVAEAALRVLEFDVAPERSASRSAVSKRDIREIGAAACAND